MQEDNELLISINHCLDQLKLYSKSTIINSCLLSGCGFIRETEDNIFEKIYNHNQYKIDEIFDNLTPISCIYKKAKPVFATPPEDFVNPGIYMWDFSGFNKTILPESQAFAIISMLTLSQKLLDEIPFLAQILIYYSTCFYEFLNVYMKNQEGLFIEVKDKTKYTEEKIEIKPSKSKVKLHNQVFIYQSILYIIKLYNNPVYKKYAKEINIKRYKVEADNIFEFIYNSTDDFISISSKNLSYVISSLHNCMCVDEDIYKHNKYKEIITLLCDELTNRIKATGEVEKGENNFTPVSFYTNVRCSNALLEGYLSTGLDKFLECANRIYKYISLYYNPSLSLFIKNYEDKVSISIRDIADILKLLYLQYKIYSDNKIIERFLDLYSVAIKNSGIVQNQTLATNDWNDYFQNLNINNKPPVFLKGIRINIKNNNLIKPSKYFNSFYALYSSYLFLNMNLENISTKNVDFEDTNDKEGIIND